MNTGEFKRPSSMVQQIHRALSTAIINSEIKPGSPLKEVELQKWFGVSRAPVREAIRLLESEGLVIGKAFQQKYVRKLSLEEIHDTFTVLACLEGFAGYLAATRITGEQIESLEQNIAQMKLDYASGEIESCTQLNFQFHRTVIAAAGNDVLRKSISSIMKAPGWHWLTRVYYNNPVLVLSSIEDHMEILSGLRSGKPEEAERIVRGHMFNIRSNWKDQM